MAPFEQKPARIVKSRLSLVYLSQSQACKCSTGPNSTYARYMKRPSMYHAGQKRG